MTPESLTSLLFIATTALSIWIFFKAAGNHLLAIAIPLAIAVISAACVFAGWMQPSPFKFPLIMVFPAVALISGVILFFTKSGRQFMAGMNLRYLTMIHVVRIPVELVLYQLFLQKTIPELMTFEGTNPDILSGLTAPVALLLFFRKDKIKWYGILIWNLLCLILLANIVIKAVLSTPTLVQQMAFDQPNTAVFTFPFVWLPCVVVPLVFLSHLVSIYRAVRRS